MLDDWAPDTSLRVRSNSVPCWNGRRKHFCLEFLPFTWETKSKSLLHTDKKKALKIHMYVLFLWLTCYYFNRTLPSGFASLYFSFLLLDRWLVKISVCAVEAHVRMGMNACIGTNLLHACNKYSFMQSITYKKNNWSNSRMQAKIWHVNLYNKVVHNERKENNFKPVQVK